MMMLASLLVAGLVSAPPISTPMRAALWTLVAAKAADLGTTLPGLGDQFREGNPLLPSRPAPLAAVVAGVTVIQVVALRRLARTHPKWALGLTWALIGAHSWAAAHNARLRWRSR